MLVVMTTAYLFSPHFSDDVDRRRDAGLAIEGARAQQDDDARLLTRLGAGDERAFAEIFRSHTTMMHRVAAALLGSSDAAADVVQSVMQRLWVQRDQLRVHGLLGAYLRVATVNASRNAIRSDQRGRAWAERAAVTLGDEAGRLHDEESLRDRRVVVLHQSIAQLAPRTREIFLLWWGGELSYAEIAQATGISIKGVERARARALEALRAALIAAGLGPGQGA
jgi:RNA polymerase sigma factor (sigma-70 family)